MEKDGDSPLEKDGEGWKRMEKELSGALWQWIVYSVVLSFEKILLLSSFPASLGFARNSNLELQQIGMSLRSTNVRFPSEFCSKIWFKL